MEYDRTFIVSRPRQFIMTEKEMSDELYYNMWRRKQWPYIELNEGDCLYWYETTTNRIVWKTEVAYVDKFEYSNKSEVQQRLKSIAGFGMEDYYLEFSQATVVEVSAVRVASCRP